MDVTVGRKPQVPRDFSVPPPPMVNRDGALLPAYSGDRARVDFT